MFPIEPVINVYPGSGPAWWITAIVATGSAAIGGLLTMLGQRIDANRRVKNENTIRNSEHRRDDMRQWDERVVLLASGIISQLNNMRISAVKNRHFAFSSSRERDDDAVERKIEADLKAASARQDDYLAELRLIAPNLYSAALQFCEKSYEIFFGIWEDVTDEGDFAMTDWRSASEIPAMIDAFATAVNAMLRLPSLPSPADDELDAAGGII